MCIGFNKSRISPSARREAGEGLAPALECQVQASHLPGLFDCRSTFFFGFDQIDAFQCDLSVLCCHPTRAAPGGTTDSPVGSEPAPGDGAWHDFDQPGVHGARPMSCAELDMVSDLR